MTPMSSSTASLTTLVIDACGPARGKRRTARIAMTGSAWAACCGSGMTYASATAPSAARTRREGVVHSTPHPVQPEGVAGGAEASARARGHEDRRATTGMAARRGQVCRGCPRQPIPRLPARPPMLAVRRIRSRRVMTSPTSRHRCASHRRARGNGVLLPQSRGELTLPQRAGGAVLARRPTTNKG